MSTTENVCPPQTVFVYHKKPCPPHGVFIYHQASMSTTGNVCLLLGICVYVVLLCMLTHLLPCPLARRTHQWTGTAGTACCELCQAKAWPAGIPLGCQSADRHAAPPHHHATAGAALEPACIIDSQQSLSFSYSCMRSPIYSFIDSLTHLHMHSCLCMYACTNPCISSTIHKFV